MNYRTIMVQVDIDGSSVPRLRFAWDLAQRFDADLIVFAAAEARIMVPGEKGGMLATEIMRQRSEEIEERLKLLEGEYHSVVKENHQASWRGLVGNPTRLLELHSRAADLVITGVPEAGVAVDHLRTVDTGTLILSAGRPILLASESCMPVQSAKRARRMERYEGSAPGGRRRHAVPYRDTRGRRSDHRRG